MTKLSKRTIDTLEIKSSDYFVWDETLPGFGIRIMPSGRKSFLIQYRDDSRRTRRKAIGRYGTITVDEAKREARELLAAVTRGENPAEEDKRQKASPTVAAVCERFLKEYVPLHCKASTAKEYKRCVELFISPAIGTHKINSVKRSHIASLQAKHSATPYQANRTLGVLSVLFKQAEIWGLREENTNPCRNVKKYEEKKRERFLSTEELQKLSACLNQMEAAKLESQAAINCIRLLILTGCRLGEIQTLKWDYIKGNSAYLPDSKTGAKRVYLAPATLEVLAGIEQLPDNPYVIVGKLPGSHLSDMQKPWRRIRKAAKLEDVRLHDLRHSFATSAVGLGESLPMIGKLLGHSQVQTTARYAHLADDPVHMAAARISDELAQIMSRTE